MAQYDYYDRRDAPGYWLDCQTDYMDHYETRLVVPLVPRELAPVSARQLNPTFEIAGSPHTLLTHFAGTILAAELHQPLGSLANHHHAITNAFDFLLTGV